MFRMIDRFVVVIFSILLAACGSVPVAKNTALPGIESSLVAGVSTPGDKPILQEHRGDVYHIRFSDVSQIKARNLRTGTDTLVFDGKPDDLRLDGLVSYSDGERLYVGFRPKLNSNHATLGEVGDKMVYVTSTTDGSAFTKPSRISSSNGAFTPVMTGTPNGDLYLVWQDERFTSVYDLYFNVSHDKGQTWKPKDVRMDPGEQGSGFSDTPFLLAEGNYVWLTWTEARRGGQTQYVLTSSDKGETWSEPVAANVAKVPSFYPQLVRSKGNLFLYWWDQKNVHATASYDDGKTWTAAIAIATVENEAAKMQELLVQSDSAGNVHLLFGKKGGGNGDKSNTFYMKSTDGLNFASPVRLSSGEEYKASSVLPTMAIDKNNAIMVSWMDYRYFRPVVMGSYSPDAGATWGRDVMMDIGPDQGASQFPYLVNAEGKWWLSLIRYDSKTMGIGRAAAIAFDEVQNKFTNPLKVTADASQIEGRVKLWWQSRLDADWGTSYELSDPFVRALTPKRNYLSSQGTIKYHSFEVVGVEIVRELTAKVKIKYVYEMPEVDINGRKYTIPKRDAEVEQDWIWVDGNWYLLFKDMFGKSFLDL
jgi:hypothetical protein